MRLAVLIPSWCFGEANIRFQEGLAGEGEGMARHKRL
jgi:hypothetical protein